MLLRVLYFKLNDLVIVKVVMSIKSFDCVFVVIIFFCIVGFKFVLRE